MKKRIEYKFKAGERAKLIRRREAARLIEYTRALVKRFGPEVIDVLAETTRDLGAKAAHRLLDELNIKERDATTAVRLLSYFYGLVGNSGEVVEATPDRAVRRESICICSDIWDFEFCNKVTGGPFLEGLCSAINPKLTFSHPKWMSRPGDGCCEVVFEMKR